MSVLDRMCPDLNQTCPLSKLIRMIVTQILADEKTAGYSSLTIQVKILSANANLIISMESGSLNHELLKFFEYDSSVPTGSAFYQQRSKLSVSAFRHLLKEFNLKFPLEKFRDNYYDIWAAVQS